LLSPLPQELAHARTRHSCDENARFSRVLFRNEALNAVLHLREISDQHDVTLESSKIVKLALTWVPTTQSDAIKKNMPFIQTSLAQSESASPKATTLYVYNMPLFRVALLHACLLNRWQRASIASSSLIAP
jgi:hypothetical protein